MSRRLGNYISSDYIEAAHRLSPRGRKRKVVVYVEGYEDIFFWRDLLNDLETDDIVFDIMLPSRSSLQKGKKVAVMNALSAGLGPSMIACVDADYDYLMQGSTEISRLLCDNPYLVHTYYYAIENFRCYAPALHTVCVMATLNDHALFDFEGFMREFSQCVFPLFVWSVWCYRNGFHNRFTMQDLSNVFELGAVNVHKPGQMIDALRKRVNSRMALLQRTIPQAKGRLKPLEETLRSLGVDEQNAYLYIRGHDIYEKVVLPLLTAVCRILTGERENEIRRLAQHPVQRSNEMSGYNHASASLDQMLRRHTDYRKSQAYRRIQQELRTLLGISEQP